MKQNKQCVQMQKSKYKNKLRRGQNKHNCKQNKITDSPQPKLCSHGTNKRMQKQVQKQKNNCKSGTNESENKKTKTK